MKLRDLGLKSKPQMKHFEDGYVSFQDREGELYYKIKICRRGTAWTYDNAIVMDKQHLKRLLSIEFLNQVLQA